MNSAAPLPPLYLYTVGLESVDVALPGLVKTLYNLSTQSTVPGQTGGGFFKSGLVKKSITLE